MGRPEAKHWCFTINNPQSEDRLGILSLRDHAVYYVVGQEVGENGTPHYQGFVSFKKKLRLTAVKKMLARAHLEQARGTPQEASDYCKKDGEFEEYGELPPPQGANGGQALAAKYQDAWEKAKRGDFESIDVALRIKHYHTLCRIRQDYHVRPPDLEDVCGIWYYGPRGTGKSYAARGLGADYYLKPTNKWWDGYQNQDLVIIEEVELKDTHLGHNLKIWADRYAFPAEMKGTTVQIRPKRIVVTSNYTIADIFKDDPELVGALERRFRVTHFSGYFPRRQAAVSDPDPGYYEVSSFQGGHNPN